MRVGDKPQGDEEAYIQFADGTPSIYVDPRGKLLGDFSACTDEVAAHREGARDHFVNSVAKYHFAEGGQATQPQNPSRAAVANFTGLEPVAIVAGMVGGEKLATSVYDIHVNKARGEFQRAADVAQEALNFEREVRHNRRDAEKLLHKLEAGKGGKMDPFTRENSIQWTRELVEEYPEQVSNASDRTVEAQGNKAAKKEVVTKLKARRAWVKAGGVVGGGTAAALALKAAKISGAAIVKAVPGVGWALTAKDVYDVAEQMQREEALKEAQKTKGQPPITFFP